MKTETDRQIDELEYELQDLKRKVAELRRQRPHEEIKDYRLRDSEGRGASHKTPRAEQQAVPPRV